MKMGNYLNTKEPKYYIYNRDKNDSWVMIPMISNEKENIEWHYGRFKHTFFELSTETVFDFYKIYLYENNTRLIRCELSKDKMTVIHSSGAASKAWENCKRSKLGVTFDKKYKIIKKTTYEIEYEKRKYKDKLIEFEVHL